jgi:hypothetical protein
MDTIPQWCPIPLQDQKNHGHHSSVMSYTFTGPDKSWTSFLSDVLYLYIITGPDKSWTSFLSDALYLYRTRHHSLVMSYTFTGPDKSWTSFLSDVLYLYRTRQIMDIIPQWCPIPLQDQTNHEHHSSVMSYTFTGPDIIPQWCPIPLQDQTSFLSDFLYLYMTQCSDETMSPVFRGMCQYHQCSEACVNVTSVQRKQCHRKTIIYQSQGQ